MPLYNPVIPGVSVGYAVGDFIAPWGAMNTQSSRTLSTSAQFFAMQFYLPETYHIDLVRIFLTTAQAGAEMRVGLYTNLQGVPNALLADLGTADLSTGGGGNKDWVANLYWQGILWVVMANKNVATGVTVNGPGSTSNNVGFGPVTSDFVSTGGVNAGMPWMAANVAYPGSMPATCPTLGRTSSTIPYPILRIAA